MGLENDAQLVDRIRVGDRVALGEIYDRHVRPVFRFALSELRNTEDAEDITQETFLTLFARAKSIHLVDHSALPWLLVTCRNHTRNRIRLTARDLSRRETSSAIDSIADNATPEGRLLATELRTAVEQAVSELPAIDRRIFELCIDGDATYDAAARTLGVSHGTIRNRLSRLRARLQKALNPLKEIKQ